jgi:hypothetical protein
MSLQDKTLFISGGSRGNGLAIAVRAASEGACRSSWTSFDESQVPDPAFMCASAPTVST